MRHDQAVANVPVVNLLAAKRAPARHGVILSGPDSQDLVLIRVSSGGMYKIHINDLALCPAPLLDDLDLIDAMEKEMKFVDDPELKQPPATYLPKVALKQLELITYFEETYGSTDQDTVVYGPEFVIVVRNILAGKRPVKLRYLTDFEGEEK
jgi:hypothetical protein